MSGQTVGQALSTPLADKIGTNGQLANLVMGIVAKIVWIAAKMGKPINGIKFGQVNENGGDFTFSVQFNSLSGHFSSGIAPLQSTVGAYVASKSQHLAKCLDANPGFLKTLEDLVTRVDGYCRHKGIAFSDWRVEKAFMSRHGVMVVRSEKIHKGRWS